MNLRKPAWWQLYLLGGLMVGLICLVHEWHASEMLRGTANIAIILTGYGVFQMWMSANGEAIEAAEQAQADIRAGKAPAVSRRQAHYRRAVKRRPVQAEGEPVTIQTIQRSRRQHL
jgi:hypothetical protein